MAKNSIVSNQNQSMIKNPKQAVAIAIEKKQIAQHGVTPESMNQGHTKLGKIPTGTGNGMPGGMMPGC